MLDTNLDVEKLKKLNKEGVNIFRINTLLNLFFLACNLHVLY